LRSSLWAARASGPWEIVPQFLVATSAGALKTKVVVLPPPCPLSIQPIDFGHADMLIERADADASEFLDDGGAERPPIHMRMHGHSDP
jgi:hypothetical protein